MVPSPLQDAQKEDGDDSAAADPKAKITIFINVHPTNIHKGIRIRPNQIVSELVAKLVRKRIIPNVAIDRLALKVRTAETSLKGSQCKDLSVWKAGIRDQDWVLLTIDDEPAAAKRQTQKESLLGKFKNAAKMLTSTSAAAVEIAPLHSGLFFGRSIQSVSSLGAPLMASYGVPAFLEDALAFIETNHLNAEGIFRLSGLATAIRSFKALADRGEPVVFDKAQDAHNATGLVKLYFREMPDPLLTASLFDAWCDAARIRDGDRQFWVFKSLLLALPRANYCLVWRLMRLLSRLARDHSQTRMTSANLAALIGPNIMWPPGRDSPAPDLEATSYAAQVTLFLINHFNVLFTESDQRSSPYLAIARAVFPFEPAADDELELHVDTIVYVTGTGDFDGWWEGFTSASTAAPDLGDNRGVGRFPHNHVDIVCQFSAFNLIEFESVNPIVSPSAESDVPSQPAASLHDRVSSLEDQVDQLKLALAQETSRRQELSSIIPSLKQTQTKLLELLLRLPIEKKSLIFVDEPQETDSVSPKEDDALGESIE